MIPFIRWRKTICRRLRCCSAFPIRSATGWLANYEVHPVDVRDTTFTFRGKPVTVHVYSPRGISFAPGIVIVHGMHRLGIDDPRLVNSARAVASSGFFVMTPLVPGIADYRVERESADLIGTAAQSFAQELNVPKVGILAISFSGGLSLLAASDPQFSQSIAWVASVGGYYDLAHVLRFFATGEAVRPDGSIEHMQPHEYGPLDRDLRRTAGLLHCGGCPEGARGPQAAARRKWESIRSADQHS